jgi:type IV secretory pathway TraG/TraD family ATPase VirD4
VDAAATLLTTTAAKIVFRQNDVETAKKFSEMMGEKIEIKTTKGADGKDSETTERKPLYSEMDIRKLDAGKQLIIIQGWAHRPIEADYCPAYQDPRLKAKLDMKESPPLPEFLIASHHAAMSYRGVPDKVYDPNTKMVRELVAVRG